MQKIEILFSPRTLSIDRSNLRSKEKFLADARSNWNHRARFFIKVNWY